MPPNSQVAPPLQNLVKETSVRGGLLPWIMAGEAVGCVLSPSPPFPFGETSDPLPTHEGYFSVWGNSHLCVYSLFHLLNKSYHIVCLTYVSPETVCIQGKSPE